MKYTVDAWGRVIFDPSSAFELIYKGVELEEVDFSFLNAELKEYNELCKRFNKKDSAVHQTIPLKHSPEEEHKIRSAKWLFPKEYHKIDVRKYCLDLCKTDIERNRVNLEMNIYEERNMLSILRCMIWLITTFREHKVVWGVGRGSSVASYCLYLIGVHKIDSIKYGLDISEFLR